MFIVKADNEVLKLFKENPKEKLDTLLAEPNWRTLIPSESLGDYLEIPEVKNLFLKRLDSSLLFLEGMTFGILKVFKADPDFYNKSIKIIASKLPDKNFWKLPDDVLSDLVKKPLIYKILIKEVLKVQKIKIPDVVLETLIFETAFCKELFNINPCFYFQMPPRYSEIIWQSFSDTFKNKIYKCALEKNPDGLWRMYPWFYASNMDFVIKLLEKYPDYKNYDYILSTMGSNSLENTLKIPSVKRAVIDYSIAGEFFNFNPEMLYELSLVEPGMFNGVEKEFDVSILEGYFDFPSFHPLALKRILKNSESFRNLRDYLLNDPSVLENFPEELTVLFLRSKLFKTMLLDKLEPIDYTQLDIPQHLFLKLLNVPEFKTKIESFIIEDWEYFKTLPDTFKVNSIVILKSLYNNWEILEELPQEIINSVNEDEKYHIEQALLTNWDNLDKMPDDIIERYKDPTYDFIKDVIKVNLDNLNRIPFNMLKGILKIVGVKEELFKALQNDFTLFSTLPNSFLEFILKDNEFLFKMLRMDCFRTLRTIESRDLQIQSFNEVSEEFFNIALDQIKSLDQLKHLPAEVQLKIVKTEKLDTLLKGFKSIDDLIYLGIKDSEVLENIEQRMFNMELIKPHKEGEGIVGEGLDPTIYALLRKMGDEVSIVELKEWGFFKEKGIKNLLRAYDNEFLNSERANYVRSLKDLSKKDKALYIALYNKKAYTALRIPKEFILNFKNGDSHGIKTEIAKDVQNITIDFKDPYINSEIKKFRKAIKENSKIKHQLWTGMQRAFKSKNHVFLWVLPEKLIPPVLKAISVKDSVGRENLLENPSQLDEQTLNESGVELYLKNQQHPNTPGNLTIGWIRYTLAKDLTEDKDDDRIWIDEIQTDFSSFFGKENTGVIYNINDLLYLLMKKFIRYIRGKGFESIYLPSAQMANSLYHREDKVPKSIYTELPAKLRFKKNIIKDLDDKVDDKPVWKLANKIQFLAAKLKKLD